MTLSMGQKPLLFITARSLLPGLLCVATCLAASGDAFADALTLDDAVDRALQTHPAVAALDAHTRALNAIPPQAGALPDPRLSLNALNMPTDTFDLDQEPMTQLQVGLSQRIPFPGKRRLKREAAQFEARAGAARAEERRDVLRRAVRQAWWRIFQFDRALEIVARNKDLMRDFIEIAETKYVVGEGLQQDVLLAQLELSRLMDREARLTGRRRGAEAELNALMDRPSDVAITMARTPPNARLPELPEQATLLAHAASSRDLLHEQRELVGTADSRLMLAKRDQYPDLRVGAAYGFRRGEDPLRGDRPDFFSVMLSVDVPLYQGKKQNNAIDQRRNERAHRQFSLNRAQRAIEAEITRSRADYEAAREQALLLQSAIIPQAQQTVASMLAGYQVNKVDFLNVVSGQLTLYNAQIDYWEALSDAKRSLAALAAAVGVEALYE